MQKTKNEELGRKTINEFKLASKIPLIVILDNIRSALNVGSVFRTADAFLIEAVYLCGITAAPPNREISKSALGATETVSWNYFETTHEAVIQLKKLGYKVICIEQTDGSIMLNDFNHHPNQKTAIIFGHEVEGVQQEIVNLCDACIEIPQQGTKHSLNIAVCSGIVMWEFYNKMKLTK